MTEAALYLDPLIPPNCLFHLGHSYYLQGKLQEAFDNMQQCVERVPSFAPAHWYLAAVCAELNYTERAAEVATLTLQLVPGFSLSFSESRLPYRNEADLSRFLDGLRKAGFLED